MRIPQAVWWIGAALCLAGAGFALARGLTMAGLIFGGAALFLAWCGYRQRGPAPHTPFRDDLIAPGRAVVFWKDGCPWCHRLLRAMAGDDRVAWVNVFRDPAGDTRCREVNEGDQLTPTAIIGPTVLRNPSAEELREALGG